MSDILMLLCGLLFLILFIFLFFIFIIFLISKFKNKTFTDFQPNLSIIIPAYNEEKNIQNCLDSIKNSDYSKNKIETIIVDDGSTDKTRKVVENNRDVILLKQNHLGKTEALNLGILKSSYDFVVTIDADCTIDKDFIKEIIKPFQDKKVGAITGTMKIKNNNSFISIFQNIEYHHNNLIRNSFSKVFDTSIWFFGALACYRKDALKEIDFFKKDTASEDVDAAMEIKRKNYKIIHTDMAIGYTTAQNNLKGLFRQRSRWWTGGTQALFKNKDMFSFKQNPSILFLFINQFFWSFYAFISLPVIMYQINYWMPYNSQNFMSVFSYLFRWFSLLGPISVIYKIPEWGLSFYSFFGVLSGILTTIMIISAIRIFKDKLNFKNALAIFFYFPYTIILNTIIILSILRIKTWKKIYFIR